MGKAVKPKVNPKLQRLKRMSIDELDRVSKQAAIKAVTKAAKVVKMNLVLKCTKRIKELKKDGKSSSNKDDSSGSDSDDNEGEDDNNSDSDNEDKSTEKKADIYNKEIEEEVAKLHAYKSIDHISIGKLLAYERYPKLFSHEISELKLKSNQGDNDNEHNNMEPPLETMQWIKSHKKFSEALGKMDSEIILLQTQKDEQVRKQQNIINAQAVTKKPAKLGKAAAHNAIFLDSLQDESDEEVDEDSAEKSEVDSEQAEIEKRREKWKMEKAARNQQNRAANKAKREQQKQEESGESTRGPMQNLSTGKKTDLSAYMPANQRDKYRERVFGEKRPTKSPKQQGLNRAERRKLEREQGAHNNTTDSAPSSSAVAPKKIVFNEDERDSKRQRVETSVTAPVVHQRNEQTYPKRDKSQNSLGESTRKDHRDLSQFAVEGKEWKESGVHPSWAAKQLSKPQIVQGQGKKITFDE